MSVTYAKWADVSLGEYAALAIIRRPDAATLIDGYWRQLHADHRVISASGAVECPDEPTRFSEQGREWLAGLHERASDVLDELEQLAAAREFLRAMGTMLTHNVRKSF